MNSWQSRNYRQGQRDIPRGRHNFSVGTLPPSFGMERFSWFCGGKTKFSPMLLIWEREGDIVLTEEETPRTELQAASMPQRTHCLALLSSKNLAPITDRYSVFAIFLLPPAPNFHLPQIVLSVFQSSQLAPSYFPLLWNIFLAVLLSAILITCANHSIICF
jgi:hypothetical protein